jgi:hypothetical protein
MTDLMALSCDVSDALIKLKVRNGGFLSGLTMWSPQRQEGATKIVGPTYTVQYSPLSDPTPKVEGHYVSSSNLCVPSRAVPDLAACCPLLSGRLAGKG